MPKFSDGEFNPAAYPEDSGIVEEGIHKATISNLTLSANKANTGYNIVVEFTIDGIGLRNWHVWSHPNEMAQNIGRSQFAKLCRRAGIEGLYKTSEEVFGALKLKVVWIKVEMIDNFSTIVDYPKKDPLPEISKDLAAKVSEKVKQSKVKPEIEEIDDLSDDIPF